MDYRFSQEQEAFRVEVREFLRKELPEDREQDEEADSEEDWRFRRQFHKKLAARGWLVPHWPRQYGGADMGILEQVIMREEMAYHRAPLLDIFGVNMLGPVLMMYGTDEQKGQHLPGIASGEVTWCQGYSEPGSGSDLASLQTRAVRDGDDYVINGQKIWTSNAHRADWMFLLARTDQEAPKHKGISFFLTPMRAPGISHRPLINLADLHGFNEVFFEDLRVPAKNIVGDENRGWYVGAALLDFERSGIGSSAQSRRALNDLVGYWRETSGNGAAPSTGLRAGSARVRHLLADLMIETEVGRFLSYRVASMQARGEVPNAESSVAKVYLSELSQRVANAGVQIMGLYGPVRSESKKWARLRGQFALTYMVRLGQTIAGGTSEIQRNIVAQRGLGLPRA
ncbi:MAG: acyl-CoA dehydrogenase family protein [Dehalococcoidia bacterium]|nr:acyl-CoA dehydrogenase family protein [Dehalococcoidia bacterium]